MDPMTIAAAAQAAGGIIQGIQGAFQKAKAKKMARANKRPVYAIQKPILDNQAIAESRAGQGISDASRQFLNQEQERGLTSSIDAILAGGGSVNNISDLYGKFQTGVSKMALVDEEMRTRNIQNLIQQNNQLAAEKDKAWQVNVYAPYADKAQAAAALSKQGTDNMWKGINSVIGAGANYATGQLYGNEAGGVYGRNGVGVEAPGAAAGGGGGFDMSGNNNPWNWYTPPSTPPFNPNAPRSAETTIQQTYPGLMLGNMGGMAIGDDGTLGGGYDMTLFGGG